MKMQIKTAYFTFIVYNFRLNWSLLPARCWGRETCKPMIAVHRVNGGWYTYNTQYMSALRPGAWWRRGWLSGKGRLHGESHVWAFLKEQKVPRGRWESFQAKGEACTKPKWHDLRVSWGVLRENLPRRLRCGTVGVGRFAQSAESETRLLQLMKSTTSIFSHQPSVPDTPLTSPVSPFPSVK